MRVPLLNASLTDCVFEVARATTVEEVNALFKAAAEGRCKGILGYEERPLVSVDFKDDPRSAIVDALSTMVVDGTQVKILAWYDNERGYVNRMVELARKVAQLRSRDRDVGCMIAWHRRSARRRNRKRPAQLHPGHGRLLGLHAHRRRAADAGALLLLPAGLHPVRSSRSCSSSTSSSASSRTWSAAGSPRGSACKTTLLVGLGMQIVALGMLAFVAR